MGNCLKVLKILASRHTVKHPQGKIYPRTGQGLTYSGEVDKLFQIYYKGTNLAETWRFGISRQEARSRRLILEGYASPPYERPYYDELFFYMVVGPDYLSLEVSRDFDGERLVAYFYGLLGQPVDQPRIQVGGRQDEEEGALMLVEWRFAPGERNALLQRLSGILGQPLSFPAGDSPSR